MKTKCIRQNTLIQKQFFILMIVPLLIGLMITLTSLAHAEWNKKDDPRLLHSPQKQGWVLFVVKDSSMNLLKPQETTIKRASR